MKAITLTLLIGVTFVAMLKGERGAGGFEPRVPPIAIEKALEHLNKHLQEKAEPDYFVDEAAFVREGKTSYWKFGTRRTELETGHAFYSVGMDGSVKILSVVKDG